MWKFLATVAFFSIAFLASNIKLNENSSLISAANPVSWNTHVPCSPIITTIAQIIGNTFDSNGGAQQSGGPYGIIPNKRALSPPCFATSGSGVSSQGTFVEIHNVKLYNAPPVAESTDCSSNYDSINGG